MAFGSLKVEISALIMVGVDLGGWALIWKTRRPIHQEQEHIYLKAYFSAS